MARPLHIEYPGAVYYLTARGNARNDKTQEDGLEYDDGGRLNDSEAAELIKSIATVSSPGNIQAYEKQTLIVVFRS